MSVHGRVAAASPGYGIAMPENPQRHPPHDAPPEPNEVSQDERDRLGQRADEDADQEDGSDPPTSAPWTPLLGP